MHADATTSGTGETSADPVRSGRTVRTYLALFAVALLAPILLFSAALVSRYAEVERTRLEREAADIATTVAYSIDREVAGLKAALDVLSTSRALEAGDLAAFRRQAAEILRRQDLLTVLSDPDGQQLVNMRIPEGVPLPKGALRWTAQDLEGRPFVTDLLVGQITGVLQFLVVAPVRREGKLTYVVQFSVPLSRLQRILAEADIPANYPAAIVDRKWIIMARSVLAAEFVGKEASKDFQRVATGDRGTWVGTTVEGIEVFGAYARSRASGFQVGVAVPLATLNAPVWRSLVWLSLLGGSLAALSTVLALLIGRRITSPLAALSREAAKLGRGEPVTALATGLEEANQVGARLAATSLTLREREADLLEANEEAQRFAYIVSHDLRSPLVNIMGFTTELEALRDDVFRRIAELRGSRDGPADPGDQALSGDFDEALGFIKASIGKMDRLINAILRLSREGRRDFSPERIDMDALVAGIRASLAHQADSAGATVVASPLPSLVSDRVALEQMFTNLVDNALKYSREGVPGRIEVTGRTEERNVVYEVRDNGRGIDARDTGRVFDLFRRSGVQDRPGEGIGLAHVRALVRRLGGAISLTSTPGRGSTFTISLPRRWAGEKHGKAA